MTEDSIVALIIVAFLATQHAPSPPPAVQDKPAVQKVQPKQSGKRR